MAKKATKAKAGPPRTCPECDRDLTMAFEPEKNPGDFAVCPHCAAIARVVEDGSFRMLKTDEWYDLMVKPAWHGLMEWRHTILERITTPSGPS
jgi:hypothetical protein